MRVLTLFVLVFVAAALVGSQVLTPTVTSQSRPMEAPAGFDNKTNEFTPQETFDADRAAFEDREEIADGLGPVYNAQACAECHQNPVSGAISQIFELRAGHSGPDGTFVNPPGGSLLQARAINAQIQERVPDGSRIAFMGDHQLISVMGFDGGTYGPVGNKPSLGTYPSFSPDGTEIVFESDGNIAVMNSDGTNAHKLTGDGVDTSPAWSPDGTKIAFASRRKGLWQIFTMDPNGENQVNISNSHSNDLEPGWSPDSRQIAFVRTPPFPSQFSDIWSMEQDGNAQTQLTATNANEGRPNWSPDGSAITFHTDRDGNWEIYFMKPSGASQTRVTNDPAVDINPAWSPDGAMIAFSSTRQISQSLANKAVWAIAPDGSNPTRLSATFGDFPAYSNDSGETVRTFRASLNVMGDGFVEATDDNTFLLIRDAQPPNMRGTAIFNATLEAPNEQRFSRFSWKGSVASLLSFSAGAYLLETGITSRLLPAEQTSLGRSVAAFDLVADPEDTGGPMGFGEDVEAFTRFMRSTKAPPRDRILVPDDANDPGSALFNSLTCNVCHTRSITTTFNPATTFNNGTFTVGPALANKVYHPFGDFLLHDIGTGDGIVETNGEMTRNLIRTTPLWGMRTRDRLMHDGGSSSPPTNSGAQSFTMNEVILRHAGQATASRTAFQALTPLQKAQLFKFLKSL
jgi:Tol biopolymer transport system component/CxxC motif-containing protein (DUF1111 family)